jgi:uncharacterized protein (DUF1015 family)
MPDLRPFRGIRYSSPSDLEDLVCPPYDIISNTEQRRLHDRHPNNAVRIELPFSEHPGEVEEERYRRAGRVFRSWLAQGVLVQDSDPSLFVYRQDFLRPDGARRRVTGTIGALRLEKLGADILPHEHTMPGPVEDRLALLRACPVNISPIYALYRGAGVLVPYFDALTGRPTTARFTDDHGTLHRMWRIRAPAEIDLLSDSMLSGPLMIADGHHRYETALAFHAEQRRPGRHDSVMCYCVDADSEDVQVLPYHRMFDAGISAGALEQRLLDRLEARSLAPGEGPRALSAARSDHPILVVLPHADVLVSISDDDVVDRVGERPRAWRGLDVVALHEVLFPQVLPEGLESLTFSSDADSVAAAVRAGRRGAGVVLRPLDVDQVMDVALEHERVPQKATYFWPKAVTGLVFRSLL